MHGGIYKVPSLAEAYGFTAIDGTCPDSVVLESVFERAKKTCIALMDAARFAKVDWKVVPKEDTTS